MKLEKLCLIAVIGTILLSINASAEPEIDSINYPKQTTYTAGQTISFEILIHNHGQFDSEAYIKMRLKHPNGKTESSSTGRFNVPGAGLKPVAAITKTIDIPITSAWPSGNYEICFDLMSTISGQSKSGRCNTLNIAVSSSGSTPGQQVSAPQLKYPPPGLEMPNGCASGNCPYSWLFIWTPVPGATQYHLYVAGPIATKPLIDTYLNSFTYSADRPTGYIADGSRLGWRWWVSALVNGVWIDSPLGHFNVQSMQNSVTPPKPICDCSGCLYGGVCNNVTGECYCNQYLPGPSPSHLEPRPICDCSGCLYGGVCNNVTGECYCNQYLPGPSPSHLEPRPIDPHYCCGELCPKGSICDQPQPDYLPGPDQPVVHLIDGPEMVPAGILESI